MRPSLSLSLAVYFSIILHPYTQNILFSYISILCSRRLRISFALFVFHIVLRFCAKKANVLLETGWSVARLPSREMSRLLWILIWWTVFSPLSMSNRPGNLILGISRYYWSEASQELSYKSLTRTVEKNGYTTELSHLFTTKNTSERDRNPLNFRVFNSTKCFLRRPRKGMIFICYLSGLVHAIIINSFPYLWLFWKKNRYLAITVSIWKY